MDKQRFCDTDTKECVENIQKNIFNKLKDLQELLSKFDNQIDNYKYISGTNKSPLRYPGGKSRACKILESILLKHFDIKKYNKLYSPFFGGGSFEFYLQNKFNFEIICNDKFKPLYNFWNVCKYDKKNYVKNYT